MTYHSKFRSVDESLSSTANQNNTSSSQNSGNFSSGHRNLGEVKKVGAQKSRERDRDVLGLGRQKKIIGK
jgi:hypothetical protein